MSGERERGPIVDIKSECDVRDAAREVRRWSATLRGGGGVLDVLVCFFFGKSGGGRTSQGAEEFFLEGKTAVRERTRKIGEKGRLVLRTLSPQNGLRAPKAAKCRIANN